MGYSHTSFGCADIPLEGRASLRGGRKDKVLPVVLIRDGALLKTLNLPKMAAAFDFVKSALHHIRASLIQSYLESMMCVYKRSPHLSVTSPANSYLR